MARKAEQKKPVVRTGDLAPVTSLIPPLQSTVEPQF